MANDYSDRPFQAIAIDVWDGTPAQVALYPANAQITYPVLMMGNAAGILQDYNCGYHYYFVIDGEGIIRRRGTWNEAAIRSVIDTALAEIELSPVGDPPPPSRLLEAYPNPFNPVVRIPYVLDGEGDRDVTLEILDLRGRVVATLVSGLRPAGLRHEAVWRGTDQAGRAAASGVYTARLTVQGRSQARLLTLLR